MAKYYIIAGEVSGDLHGSNLLREIRNNDPTAIFRGIGGDKMIAEGCQLLRHLKEISFMGFKEVISNLHIIRKTLASCKKDLLEFKPDVVILIDYPGFNFRIASFAKKQKFKVVYYILPQIWAWKEGRVRQLRKNTDLLISILPFEKAFYSKHQTEVFYCGHPLYDLIDNFQIDINFKSGLKSQGKKLIAVLPGSRQQEVKKILPIISEIIDLSPEYHFLIAGTTNINAQLYDSIKNKPNVSLVFNQAYNILSIADAAIITSGTATLETALFNVPMVVCYKTTSMTYHLSKALIKVRFISLVNLILDKEVVKELIQEELNRKSLILELDKILNNSAKRENMDLEYRRLKEMIGPSGASKTASKIIQELIA